MAIMAGRDGTGLLKVAYFRICHVFAACRLFALGGSVALGSIDPSLWFCHCGEAIATFFDPRERRFGRRISIHPHIART